MHRYLLFIIRVMKNLKYLFILFLLAATTPGFAQNDIKVINLTTAGKLAAEIGSNDKLLKIQQLKISGPINGDDIITIRRITALTYLDLKDAKIVSGGRMYDSDYTGVNRTENDTIGTYMFCATRSLVTIYLPPTIRYIGKNAFEGCTSLTSIVIPEGVTGIDDYAFSKCSGLSAITFPSTLNRIGENAFLKCALLTDIKIPDNVSSIGESAFEDCVAMKNVSLPSMLKELGTHAFKGCENLLSIYCYNKEPLTIDTDDNSELPFDSEDPSNTYEKATLYVPVNTKAAYSAVSPWKQFKNIKEM